MQLTEHFFLEELVESDTATRLGINNHPKDGMIVDNLLVTATLLEDARKILSDRSHREIPIHVTSGYRCERLERQLCIKDFGAWCYKHGYPSNSEKAWLIYFSKKSHPKGMATDIKAPRFGSPLAAGRELTKHHEFMKNVDQLIVEGNWLHISWGKEPRGMILLAEFDKHGVPSYSTGLEDLQV